MLFISLMCDKYGSLLHTSKINDVISLILNSDRNSFTHESGLTFFNCMQRELKWSYYVSLPNIDGGFNFKLFSPILGDNTTFESRITA